MPALLLRLVISDYHQSGPVEILEVVENLLLVDNIFDLIIYLVLILAEERLSELAFFGLSYPQNLRPKVRDSS